MTYRRVTVLGVVAGLLLSIPSLWCGFLLDDYAQFSMIEKWYPQRGDDWNLYSNLSSYLPLPWWTSEHCRISFWRPLTSGLIRLDHQLFGRDAAFYHLHSLVWLAILLAGCAALYTILPKQIAGLALLLYAVDECHALTTGWIANRHAVVSAGLGVIGLAAYAKWRLGGRAWLMPIGVAGLVGSLLAGETGLSLLAYGVCFELFGGAGRRVRR